MQNQRQVVDYGLQRRALLADVTAGRVAADQVRDASPYLLRAARFHGRPTDDPCPLCSDAQLDQVSWIFGEELRHAAGSARHPDEIGSLANSHRDFSVYVVEVCRACGWNHLVLSYVTGTGDAPDSSPRRPARRRTAAE